MEEDDLREAVFLGDSQEVIRTFPPDIRQDMGTQILRLQKGSQPEESKPFKTVGPGAREIIVSDENEYRAFYVTKFGGKVIILHAFIKKSQKTPQKEIDKAKDRYKEARRRFGDK